MKLRYVCNSPRVPLRSQELLLDVPWLVHSGWIPPPSLTFYNEGLSYDFYYQGVKD